jgi:alpha-ribazole phosphatase
MSMESNQPITRLWLIRHGQPEAEVQGRCYGSLDVGLSPEGRRQMECVAARLGNAPLRAVYSSPRRRAAESAHLIAAGHSLQTTTLDALSEINFGSFEGLSYEEIERRYPVLYGQWMESPTEIEFPNGESFSTMRCRVRDSVQRLRQRHSGESIAIVAHGGVNRILLADALEMPKARIFRIGQRYAAVNRIDYFEHEPLVEMINECWW